MTKGSAVAKPPDRQREGLGLPPPARRVLVSHDRGEGRCALVLPGAAVSEQLKECGADDGRVKLRLNDLSDQLFD